MGAPSVEVKRTNFLEKIRKFGGMCHLEQVVRLVSSVKAEICGLLKELDTVEANVKICFKPFSFSAKFARGSSTSALGSEDWTGTGQGLGMSSEQAGECSQGIHR